MHPVSDEEEAGGSGMSTAPRKYVLMGFYYLVIYLFKSSVVSKLLHYCSLLSGPDHFQMKMMINFSFTALKLLLVHELDKFSVNLCTYLFLDVAFLFFCTEV